VILDNFETVCSMPDPTGATAPLDGVERERLKRFVGQLALGGRSAIVITSRSPERWLGDVRRIAVGGLASDEAIEYADQILAAYPTAAPRRARPAFAGLLQWLDGHPLSMRLILRQLATTDPETLLGALQGTRQLPADPGDEGGRLSSLPASIGYSFEHLPPDARRVLVAACLFHGVADTRVLAIMSSVAGAPERFTGTAREGWAAALDRAAAVGLLSALGAGMYRMHPALPAFLAARWRSEDPDHHGIPGNSTPASTESVVVDIGSQRRGARSWRVRFLIPLSIRACGFPAHGLPMIFLVVTTRTPGSGRCRAGGSGYARRRGGSSRRRWGPLSNRVETANRVSRRPPATGSDWRRGGPERFV
jgi:hypothetical protein